MDHLGLVRRIVEQSGAHVLTHENDIDRLSDPLGYFKKEQE